MLARKDLIISILYELLLKTVEGAARNYKGYWLPSGKSSQTDDLAPFVLDSTVMCVPSDPLRDQCSSHV